MLPQNLSTLRGSAVSTLTEDERTTATRFTVVTADAAGAVTRTNYKILSVTVTLRDAYLQVLRIKYKGVSPERPLSNVYTSHRSTFTPLLKVSLHQYPLSWESAVKPTAVFISFIK